MAVRVDISNFSAGLVSSGRAFLKGGDDVFTGFLLSKEIFHVGGGFSKRPPLMYLSPLANKSSCNRLFKFVIRNSAIIGEGVLTPMVATDGSNVVKLYPVLGMFGPDWKMDQLNSVSVVIGEGDRERGLFDAAPVGNRMVYYSGGQKLGHLTLQDVSSSNSKDVGLDFYGADKIPVRMNRDTVDTSSYVSNGIDPLPQNMGDSFVAIEYSSLSPSANSIVYISEKDVILVSSDNNGVVSASVVSSSVSTNKWNDFLGVSSAEFDGKLVIAFNKRDANDFPVGFGFNIFQETTSGSTTSITKTTIVLPRSFGNEVFWVVDSGAGMFFATDLGIYQGALVDSGLAFATVTKIIDTISAVGLVSRYKNIVFFVGDEGRSIYYVRYDRFQLGAIISKIEVLGGIVGDANRIVKMFTFMDDTADLVVCLTDDGRVFVGSIYTQGDGIALAFSQWFCGYETYNIDVISTRGQKKSLFWAGRAGVIDLTGLLSLDDPPVFSPAVVQKPYLDFYMDVVGNDFLKKLGDNRPVGKCSVSRILDNRYEISMVNDDSEQGTFKDVNIGMFVLVGKEYLFRIFDVVNGVAMTTFVGDNGEDNYGGFFDIVFDGIYGISHLHALGGSGYDVACGWDDFVCDLNVDIRTDNLLPLPSPRDRARFGIKYSASVVTSPIRLSSSIGTGFFSVKVGFRTIGWRRSDVFFWVDAGEGVVDTHSVENTVDMRYDSLSFITDKYVLLPADKTSFLMIGAESDDIVPCWISNISISSEVTQ